MRAAFVELHDIGGNLLRNIHSMNITSGSKDTNVDIVNDEGRSSGTVDLTITFHLDC